MMKTQVCDAIIHIDESLENWQYNVLEDHMRVQKGVITTGHNNNASHILFVEYNPNKNNVNNLLKMIKRHGYHAERIN